MKELQVVPQVDLFQQSSMQTSRIPFIDPRQNIQSNKHIHSRLVQRQNPVCIPCTQSDTQSNLQVEQRRPRDPGFSRNRLANQKLVFSTTHPNKEEIPNPSTRGSSLSINKSGKQFFKGNKYHLTAHLL